MNYKNTSYTITDPAQSPFKRLDAQYTDLLDKERKEKRLWIIVSIILLIYTLGSIWGWIYAINLPKTIPMVIEVAPWGEAKNAGDVSTYSYGTIQVPEKSREWQIKDFIKKLRSISSDGTVVYDNATQLFYMITRNCEERVKEALRNPDVFALVGKKQVSVVFESIIRVSEKSYQVDWIETTTGEGSGRRRYRGVFTIELLEPSKKHRDINPLGIFLSDYDITEIKGDIL